MKKNQKLLMSAATLAVLASSLSGACSAEQSQSLDQLAADPVDYTDASSSAGSTSTAGTTYADGTYTGDPGSTRWGDVQVSVVIADGALTDIQFLTYPDGDQRSAEINAQATGMLIQEAIEAQSADVQVISGATFTSQAFMQSLDSALSQAQ